MKEEFPPHLQRAIDAALAYRDVAPDRSAPVITQFYARGMIRESKMNKTEARYAEILKNEERCGRILWYCFEGITLKLAGNTRYTPDFATMLADGTLQIDEVKGGFIREDSWQKLKIAASMYPFIFRLCQFKNNEWSYKVV